MEINGQEVDVQRQTVVSAEEPWGRVVLSDGTVIRFRAIVVDIWKKRLESQQGGEPEFFVQTQMVVKAEVPGCMKG